MLWTYWIELELYKVATKKKQLWMEAKTTLSCLNPTMKMTMSWK